MYAKIIAFLLLFALPVMANDIYVTQSGATLDLDITQDGQNNTVGNSTTASTVSGATTTIDIDQVGNSNVLKFDVNGATFTGTFSTTGNSADAANATVSITGSSGSDSNVVAATIDGTSAILTLTVNGDTNNFLIDINGDGDVNGHTLVHSHTGSIADVDITQSGVYDNIINLTTSGDNHDIDISQTD